MKFLLKTFTKPTKVFIFGHDFLDQDQTISLTDDYSGLVIIDNNKIIDHHFETCGHVFIYSEEELEEKLSYLDVDEPEDYDTFHVLENFVGSIYCDVAKWTHDNFMGDSVGEYESVLSETISLGDYMDDHVHDREDGFEYLLLIEGKYTFEDEKPISTLI